jgi:hypothetical protein
MNGWNSEITTLRFNKFLLDNWRGKTPGELASIWNKENSRYRTNSVCVVHSLNRLKIKIPTDEIQGIKRLREKESAIKKGKRYTSSKDLFEQIKAERIKLMMVRVEKNRDLWTGMEAEESVYHNEQ